MNKNSIRTWIEKFNNGEFNDSSKTVQTTQVGWYDWWCRESSLVNKTKTLGIKIKKIAKSSKIDIDSTYLCFKNNCPVNGSLYDDFRICDIETGDVVYTVVPKVGHESRKNLTEIWGRENDFYEPLYMGDWKGALKWFGV